VESKFNVFHSDCLKCLKYRLITHTVRADVVRLSVCHGRNTPYGNIVILGGVMHVLSVGANTMVDHCLRRGSTAALLLGLRVRIPQLACLPISCECCVLSGRGLCDEPIPCPEESYRVCVCII
jgi:hypothetical protein